MDNKEQMAVTAKLLAKHLQTWDLKDHQGRSVKCKDPGLIARLSPQLFDKVGDIVTGAVASDADPQGGEKPSDGEAFAETGLGNSNPG